MTDYTDLQKAAEYAAQDTIKFADEREEMRALQQFHEEVDPDLILALIADNERLKTSRSTTERDLAQELEVWRNGPSCWSCGDTGDVHDMVGEWRGKCDCNAAKLIDAASDRDQLKAENENLKTVCGAFDRVNTKLKAENEVLRKDAERYRYLRDCCGLVEYKRIAGSIGPGMLPSGERLDITVDAVMGRRAPHG